MRIKRTKIIISLPLAVFLFTTFYVLFGNERYSKSQPKSYYTLLFDSADELENVTDRKAQKNTTPSVKYYILQWTSPKTVPFMFMGTGRQGFIDKNCPYTNCFVTGDKKYFGDDTTPFDVIAFAGPEVIRMSHEKLPPKRSPHQKFVFASIESPEYYPVCSNKFDGYFNWTWTFKLDSEVKWGYMVIRDSDNNVVGPKTHMNWIKFEDMEPIRDELKKQLKSKTKAVAWFVSNCNSKSKRETFVKDLQNKLKEYDLTVDIYGSCGPLKCSRAKEDECYRLIKEEYYFYLSFENAFSEDYVTEKLLNAVMHDAVPIVYGGANYSRFLPDGSYLNARELGAQALAERINESVHNRDVYHNYFRWKKYYSYHMKWESPDTNEYCLFCTILNNEHLVKERKVYHNFREWWDPPGKC